MAYRDFKLSNISKIFEVKITESSQLFADVPEIEASELLTTILKENINLAVSINTEKARLEMIIAPILIEIRCQLNYHIVISNKKETLLSAVGTDEFI